MKEFLIVSATVASAGWMPADECNSGLEKQAANCTYLRNVCASYNPCWSRYSHWRKETTGKVDTTRFKGME